MTTAAIAAWLGGARGPQAPHFTDADLLIAVERGLPVSALESVIRAGRLTADEADRIVLPRRTLAYRRKHRQRLSLDESDRLARVARVAARAEETFGPPERATMWLRRPNRALAGRAPLDLLVTGEGALIVESVLVRIDDGVYE
jgi:putative toxin-antitoxin system antitoxin component (TIGR02293 family)